MDHLYPLSLDFLFVTSALLSEDRVKNTASNSYIVEVEVEVEVNLRPTVNRPVCSGIRRPSGTCDQFVFSSKFPSDSCVFVIL
jgi:hypothetical protein